VGAASAERAGDRAPATPPAAVGTALGVLSAVLERDGQQRSATQARSQALADADHLALLHAIWIAETSPAREQRYRDLVAAAPPPCRHARPGPWDRWLWRTLHAAELAGLDPAQILASPRGVSTSADTFRRTRSCPSACRTARVDEAAQVAREVLARHEASAPVRTEFWSVREQEWRDAAGEPSADPVAERQALHEARQERERQALVTSGRPAREVWVELPSHDDVVALAGYLAAREWRVRPHRRHLIVGADCEDDAKSVARELTGDGGADADTAFRVRRVDIYASWTDGGAFSGGGP
jgi:hypothetical protein